MFFKALRYSSKANPYDGDGYRVFLQVHDDDDGKMNYCCYTFFLRALEMKTKQEGKPNQFEEGLGGTCCCYRTADAREEYIVVV